MKTNWSGGLGSLGSLFAAKCPACGPAIGAVLSAVGLGVLVNYTVMMWLTIAFLLIGIGGLYLNSRKHGMKAHLLIGILASALMFSAQYALKSVTTTYVGAGVLLINAFFDYRRAKTHSSCCAVKLQKRKKR